MKYLVNRYRIQSIEELGDSEKYDKMLCHTCRLYQYLSVLKCVCCNRKYCLEHVDRCCGKKMIFMTRIPDASRKKIIDLVTEKLE